MFGHEPSDLGSGTNRKRRNNQKEKEMLVEIGINLLTRRKEIM